MAFETERKFMVVQDLWAKVPKPAGIRILQGYISDNEMGIIRVRIMDDLAFITVKGRSAGITRAEFEFPIPYADAVALLQQLSPPVVEKTRYLIPFSGKTWEVDVFEGANAGLLIAEIELASEDEAYEKPAFAGEEVTSDHRYNNSYLAKKPVSTW